MAFAENTHLDYEYEYEYEYDGSESEVSSLNRGLAFNSPCTPKPWPQWGSYFKQIFYVDLDLSSLKDVIRPRLQNGQKSAVPAKRINIESTPNIDTPTPVPTTVDEIVDNDEVQDLTVPPNISKPYDEGSNSSNDIQILELHSQNPIVSYQNQTYSCAWSEMIGTNMFFAEHSEEPCIAPLRSTNHYDLLSISRIKLTGQRAKVTNKPGAKRKRATGDDGLEPDTLDEESDPTPGKSLGNLRFANATINADLKKQAKFLEKFMDVKRAKGETDNVRTVFRNTVTSRNATRGPQNKSGTQAKQDMAKEIEELNRRVVRGDADALARLQKIYSGIDGEAANSSTPETPAAGMDE